MTAPWRSPLARALHRNRSKPYSRYLQLATVTPEGYPANRTVVFRGFKEASDSLKFITDLRSEKITHIQHQSRSEACWYFTQTREQFRLTGNLTLVTSEANHRDLQLARQTTWQNLSDAARTQFAWPDPKAPQAKPTAFDLPVPPVANPLPNFCLLLLTPIKVDHLELRGEPQNRWLYHLETQNNTWLIQAVNP